MGYELLGDPPKLRFVRGFHASGHLSQGDLTRVIEEIDPDTIIPIHTAHPEWFRSKFDGVIKVEEGVAYEL